MIELNKKIIILNYKHQHCWLIDSRLIIENSRSGFVGTTQSDFHRVGFGSRVSGFRLFIIDLTFLVKLLTNIENY